MNDPLTDLVATYGDKTAVVDDRPDGTVLSWTFNDLEANANRLGRVLTELGLERGTRAIWCGRNSRWIVGAMQALRKIGAVSVPLNYRSSAEEAAYIIDNSDAEYIIADAEFAPLLEEIRDNIPKVKAVLVFDGEVGENQLDLNALAAVADPSPIEFKIVEGAAVSMTYTSGTTGRPKGAVRESAGNPQQMISWITDVGYAPDDIYMPTGPLYHSGPASFMGIGLMMGQTIVLQRKFEAEDWLRLWDKYKITSTFSAPTPIRRICNLDPEILAKYDLSTMHVMIANAAPWSFALKKAYLDLFPHDSLYECYGSTELGVNTVLYPPYQLTKPGSCGQVVPGVEIILVDEDRNVITEPNVRGELYVRGETVFTTYHKAQEKFDEDSLGDMQTVGDIAYFDEEGFYYICDRKKDMIISGGMNIYPAEIEDTLEHHPDILDAAVFGIPNEEWGESVHAVLVLRPGASVSEADVEAFCREHLASYKLPRSIDFMEDIPRTGSGKILKRVLREPYWQDHNSQVV
jgi:acyl-CoA synthetase (AMP-forming)/AMP-acid ligase II